jgi:surface protein
MFEYSEFNGDISKWDVSKVTNMSYMFSNSKFNGDISKWDVSNVNDMESMFAYSKFNGDISNWNVSNVINMRFMYKNSKFNGDISKWNISSVIDGKQYILKYININVKWKEERVKYEELICNVYYEKIESKYVKCEVCKNVYDYCIKEEWINEKVSCPMCRSEWINNKVYVMVSE